MEQVSESAGQAAPVGETVGRWGRTEILWPAFVGMMSITISILLALGADAWWEGRQEALAAHELLERLRDDLSGLYQGAENVRQDHERFMRSTAELLTTLQLGEQVPMDPRTDSAVALAMFNYRTFNPRREGVDDGLRNIHLIQNAELRVALQTIPRLIADLQEEEAVIETALGSDWLQHWASKGSVNPYMRIEQYRVNDAVGLEYPIRDGRSRIVVDQKILNDLEIRMNLEKFVVYAAGNLHRSLGEIQELLEAEIARHN